MLFSTQFIKILLINFTLGFFRHCSNNANQNCYKLYTDYRLLRKQYLSTQYRIVTEFVINSVLIQGYNNEFTFKRFAKLTMLEERNKRKSRFKVITSLILRGRKPSMKLV